MSLVFTYEKTESIEKFIGSKNFDVENLVFEKDKYRDMRKDNYFHQ